MKFKILSGAILISGSALVTEAYAACTPQSGFRSQDVSMSVGRVVVRPSDPVGTVLRKATFPISSNGSTYFCNSSGGTIHAQLIQNFDISPVGDSVYNTNIPGIGIRLYREASDNQDFSGYYPYSKSLNRNTNYSLSPGFFVVEIVKTANTTGSGAITPGQYSTYYVDNYSTQPFLTSTVYGTAITIASSSCEILGNINKTVTLPTVNKSDFSGIGSTAGEQPLDLNILCNGGENPSGVNESNKISINFDFNAATNNESIINEAPANTKANGVNTQLIYDYQNQNKLITKGSNFVLGNVNSNQSVQYNLPLRARYIQTENNVTPGTVRGLATVTIQYD